MAFLRAFIDDSAAQKGDKRLFYAGYLHRTDVWAEFSEAWEWELRQWPAIEYFKGSGNQFDGWDRHKRDAKIAKLAGMIRHFEPFSFHFSLNRKLFEEILKPVSPYGLARPHFTACFSAISGVTRYAASQGITTPIEFIFDQQEGVDKDVGLFFSEMIKQLPSEARNLISGQPQFKNDRDKQFIPLQAADLLVWHVRREHEYPDKPLPLMSDLLNPRGHLISEIPDEMIIKWADHHSALPGVPSIQSQPQWGKLTRQIKRLQTAGIDPRKITKAGVYYSEGTPFIAKLIDRIRRLLTRT